MPIYRGCLNTHEHGLDERAFIRFTTIPECIDICNQLTLDDYYKRLEYVKANREVRQAKGQWLEHVKELILNAWTAKQTSGSL